MKVILVSSAAPEHRIEGGVVSHLDVLRRDLTRRGHQVHTLTATPTRTEERVLNGAISYARPALYDGIPLRYHLGIMREYSRLREEFSPDVVHIHSHSGVALAMKERSIPIVTTVHAVDSPKIGADLGRAARAFGLVEKAVKGRQIARLLECSDKVFVPSAKAARDLRGYCSAMLDSPEILPVGVDPRRFRPTAKDEAKERLGYAGRFVVLFVGRMTRKKGVNDLVQAAPEILGAIPEAVFLIIGTGAVRDAMMREARRLEIDDRVDFVGTVPNSELPKYYSASDVFVNPTRENETFGLTTVEAMSCGLPVVISRQGAETGIASAEVARIFDSRDGLVSEVVLLSRDPELRKTLAALAQRHAGKYSSDAVVTRLERCYQQLVAAGKSRRPATIDRRWVSFWLLSSADGLLRWLRRMRYRFPGIGKGRP